MGKSSKTQKRIEEGEKILPAIKVLVSQLDSAYAKIEPFTKSADKWMWSRAVDLTAVIRRAQSSVKSVENRMTQEIERWKAKVEESKE